MGQISMEIFGRTGSALSGNQQSDHLRGDGGQDTLRGQAGADTYLWSLGSGNDVISEGSSTAGEIDTLVFGDVNASGIELKRSGSDLSIVVLGSGETIKVNGYFSNDWAGIERIEFADGAFWTDADIASRIWQTGTDAAEILNGMNSWDDQIKGLGGNDTIKGGSGDDILVGGAGADSLDGETGIDTASYETAGSAVTVDLMLTGAQTGPASDAFGDKLVNIEGLIGSNYGDVLKGNDDSNRIDGLGGNDSILGFDGYDQLNGGLGNDTLDGGIGSDLIDGGDGSDSLLGGEGDDSLLGGAGNDTISGGNGADILAGGAGADRLIGGSGADMFVFANLNGADTVADFASEDRIDLSQVEGLDDFADLAGKLTQVGSNVLLSLPTGDTILFESAILATFIEQSFLFG